jgi:hypothetical protein
VLFTLDKIIGTERNCCCRRLSDCDCAPGIKMPANLQVEWYGFREVSEGNLCEWEASWPLTWNPSELVGIVSGGWFSPGQIAWQLAGQPPVPPIFDGATEITAICGALEFIQTVMTCNFAVAFFAGVECAPAAPTVIQCNPVRLEYGPVVCGQVTWTAVVTERP